MADDAPLVPLEEKRVDFYGDEIVAVLVDRDGQHHIYVPLRPIVTYLGLTWASQTLRLRRDPVLSRHVRGVFIMKTPGAGGTQKMTCLPLEFLPGFLFGISASRVKEAYRATIIRYQEECFRILWEAFKPHILREETALAATDGDPAIQELQRIAEMGRAIAQMAEQQIELQRQQQALTQRLDKAGRVVRGMQLDIADIQVRLGSVEDKLHPHAYITDEQATHIAQLVKALAELLGEQDRSKNQYQGIFGELYRRFGVSSYKLIRIEQYDAVLAFLEQWRGSVAGGAG
ncbi:MAG: hypothetical protein HC911_15175 [Chloroflexaceae bacterium]|nr:hypothetical protein [Chloroflexaceae bacterium]